LEESPIGLACVGFSVVVAMQTRPYFAAMCKKAYTVTPDDLPLAAEFPKASGLKESASAEAIDGRHDGWIARAVGLDIAVVGWKPTVDTYLGRVTKPHILEAVREAKGEQSCSSSTTSRKATWRGRPRDCSKGPDGCLNHFVSMTWAR
jgi:hypothetical protein